nr:hypothetical protein [Methanobrevibacter smithii]
MQYNTYGIYLEDVSNDLNINFNIISHNYGFNFIIIWNVIELM